MSSVYAAKNGQLLFRVVLGLMPFLVIGLGLIYIVKRESFFPFLQSLFVSDVLSFLEAALLGLSVGVIIIVGYIVVFTVANIEIPDSEGKKLIEKILRTPGGIAVTALGGGIIEEFFFRGVLIGLFIGSSTLIDWSVIAISTLIFWALHLPQYKGSYFAYAVVFIIGLIFALLFYFTGSLIAPMIAHGVYNLGVGVHFVKTSKREKI
ncbi:CPBP family intramembrane glutamic endopeptidase [Aureibacillus halotolerans]|uniref:CAAX prenyl protease 2/Lysostaphin resistance protein A-like domain-containing protein n=1 Tax=Aureibacillus halotolerans TaxID=1508390 RepID=A0A4V3D499_9BACI|nr:type II CAAX endopeptidase family protein [Aureibacillus halotolerans]TDQ33785.1 hypothetical protein EV213_12817 [Aureibacillus halotolerans]